MEDIEGGNLSVPFEEHGDPAGAAMSFTEKRPNVADHGPDVGIDDVPGMAGVPGDVELNDPVVGHVCEVGPRVESMVIRAHIHIVHVEKDCAVRELGKPREKLPLGHGSARELHIGRWVLECEGRPEEVLHATHTLSDMMSASSVYGSGKRSCVFFPATPVQQR